MIRLAGNYVLKFVAGMLTRLKSYSRIHLNTLDLEDVFPANMQDLIVPERKRNFRVLSSIDDYNRELSNIFQAHSTAFYLDRSHNDGHFRV
jgi:hypothetical protein